MKPRKGLSWPSLSGCRPPTTRLFHNGSILQHTYRNRLDYFIKTLQDWEVVWCLSIWFWLVDLNWTGCEFCQSSSQWRRASTVWDMWRTVRHITLWYLLRWAKRLSEPRHGAFRRKQTVSMARVGCLLCSSVVDDPVEVSKNLSRAHLYIVI